MLGSLVVELMLTWEYIRKRASCGASTASLNFVIFFKSLGRVEALLASLLSIEVLISSTMASSRAFWGLAAILR